jgi:hypothetical protein
MRLICAVLRFNERPEFAKALAAADKFGKFGLDERDPAKLAPEIPIGLI